MQILETAEAAINIEINDAYTVEIKNSAAAWVIISSGKITDIDIVVERSGHTLLVQRISLIGAGRLAILSQAQTTGELAEDLDGAQVIEALRCSEIETWADVDPALTWDTYSPTATWRDILEDFGAIDAGSYMLAARAPADTDAYSLASAVANSGAGYLYEDINGKICYADGTHRSAYIAVHGLTTISAGTSAAKGLKISKKRGNIRNQIVLTYGAAGLSKTVATDMHSVHSYGLSAQPVSTTLLNLADADAQAAFYLVLRAYPMYLLESVTFDLESPALSDTARDALLGVFMGMPLDLIDLPANMDGGQFQGFVEGWTFSAGYKRLSLTLLLSPLAFSLRPMTWASVSVSELWNTLEPTMDYAHAIVAA
jgi:hypothetical protein